MENKISIIIPLYNHELYIKDAINSALNQTVDVFEIIVIDDGSKDNSGKIVIEAAKNDTRIKYFYQENAGAHNAINRGIKMVTGDYIAILNSDDAYHPLRFEKIIKDAVVTQADFIYTGISFIDPKGNKISNEWYQQARRFYLETSNFANALVNGNFIMTTSNLFAKKDIFDRIGFFENLRYAHDLDFFLRLAVFDLKISCVNEELVYYRTHETNTIKEDYFKVKNEWALVTALFIAEYNKNHPSKEKKDFADNIQLYNILKRHELTDLVVFYMQLCLGIKNRAEYYDYCMENSDLKEIIADIIK